MIRLTRKLSKKEYMLFFFFFFQVSHHLEAFKFYEKVDVTVACPVVF